MAQAYRRKAYVGETKKTLYYEIFKNYYFFFSDHEHQNNAVIEEENVIDELSPGEKTVIDPKTKKLVKKENFWGFSRRISRKAYELFLVFLEYVWRFCEIHIYKAIVILIAMFCLVKVELFF